MTLSGNILDYAICFWSGVLVSFSPCVYPVMPLTASFLASINTRGTKLNGFLISLVYVLGIAITYCGLAIFASLTGKVFGQLTNSAITYIVVANILLFFALVMSDLVPLPNIGVVVHDKIEHKNFWTVILFGAASGLMIGPCTTPILVTLLLYIASKHNILHGISLMFFFSYGVGASLILIGTFSGILGSLPKSGKWMVRIKQFSGLIFIIMAQILLIKAGQLW